MDYDPNQAPGGFTVGKFIALGVILTIGIIAGIKYVVSDNSSAPQPAANDQQLFKPAAAGNAAPQYNPASRPESYSSGGALDMFAKANEGYSKEVGDVEESTEPPAEVKKATAAPVAARAAAKPAAGGTVIPRLKPVQGFGSDKKASPKGGGTDISAIVDKAMKAGNLPKKDPAR